MDACADECMYLYEEPPPDDPPDQSDASSSRGGRTPRTSSHASLAAAAQRGGGRASASKSYKRRRLRENLAQLAHGGEVDSPRVGGGKRRSDGTRRSLSLSMLDNTGEGTILAGEQCGRLVRISLG